MPVMYVATGQLTENFFLLQYSTVLELSKTSEWEREVTSKKISEKIRVTDKTNVEALRKRFVGGEDLFGTGGEIK